VSCDMRSFVLLLSFLFLFAPGLLLAQAAPESSGPAAKDAWRMGEVVVTATRDAREVRKVPANVTVITAADIGKSGATSVAEVLTGLAGIHVTSSSGNASQATVDMRGFGTEAGYLRNVVLLDGRRLNRPDLASVNWLEIPLAEIERIEIVRGAGSVLYGDAAIAGVVNIITKRGEGRPKGEVSVIGGSYNTYDGRVGVRGSADKLYYALNGEMLRSSGYRDRSRFTSGSAGGSIGYNPTESLDVSLGITYNKTDTEFPGALKEDQLAANRKQAQNPDDDGEAEFFDANLLVKTVLGVFGRLDANLIYGRRKVESNYASFPSFTDIDIETLGATPRYILERKVFGFDNKVTVGFDVYRDELDKDTFTDRSRTSRTHEAGLTRETMGLYARDEFSILRDLILAVGARTERAEVRGSETKLDTGEELFDDEKIHKGEAWEVSLTYLLGEKSKLWGKYATTYRFPSLDQQASYYGFGDTFLTDLEKEKGKSYEAGAQISPLPGLLLGVTGYLIDMKDEISYNDVTKRNENLDETRHRGVEFSLAWQLRSFLRVSANYTLQDAYFRDGANKDKDVPLVPNHMAGAAVEIDLPWNLTLRPEVQYVGSQYFGSDNNNDSEKLDDYTIVNLALRWHPDRKIFGVVTPSAFVAVDNLFDKRYSSLGYEVKPFSPDPEHPLPPYPTYYPAPTINVRGGVTLSF
jgi:iron complex outermembrane recepter protein